MIIDVENLKNGSHREIRAGGVFIFAGMKPDTGLFNDTVAAITAEREIDS